MYKPRAPKPKPSKASKASCVADTTMLFDGIEHLSLHGGVNAGGQLVVIPLFPAVHLKTISKSGYCKEAASIMQSAAFSGVMETLQLPHDKIEEVKFTYPGLTGGIPLPNSQVIDHVVRSSLDVTARRRGEKRMEQFLNNPRWYEFQSPAFVMRGDYEALIRKLIDINNEFPGLLSPLFQPTLAAILQLYEMIDRSEQNGQMVVATCHEIATISGIHEWYGSENHLSLTCKRSFSRYIQDMRKDLEETAQTIVSNATRITCRSQSTLDKILHDSGTSRQWALIADVGYAGFSHFRKLLSSLQQQSRVTINGATTNRYARRFVGVREYCDPSDSAVRFACTQFSGGIDVLALFWTILVQRALKQGFYVKQQSTATQFMAAWQRRFANDSVLASILEVLPARPQLEGGALIIKRESDSAALQPPAEDQLMLRVEPAILKPHAAALKAASVKQLKRYPALNDRYLLASHWLDNPCEGAAAGTHAPSLYIDADEQIIWPHGRLWQVVDFTLTLASYPALLLCPEILYQGYLQMSNEQWSGTGIPLTTAPQQQYTWVSWRTVNDWCVGTTPIANMAMQARQWDFYHFGEEPCWPIATIDAGIGAFEVSIAVEFVPIQENKIALAPGLLAHLIRNLAKLPAQQRSEELDAALKQLGEQLCFEARPYFAIDGHHIGEREWFAAAKTKNGFYQLDSGIMIPKDAYVSMTDQFILRQRVYAKFKRIGLAQVWAIHQSSLREGHARLDPQEYLRQLALSITPLLSEIDQQTLSPLAEELLAERLPDLGQIVRPYQAIGIAWVFLRFKLGFGVCLADEMGLGKTLQAIALLRILKQPGKPSLVIMPKTLLGNWRRELIAFGGGVKFGIYPEQQPHESIDLLLVTYPRLRIAALQLTEVPWNLVILDEAQAIKNSDSQTAEAASRLQATYRLTLTGTPIENRAAELWSLIDWLNPGYLGRQSDFAGYTTLARSSAQKRLLLAPLRECLDPIILRRTKQDPAVQLDLPDKIYHDHLCELSEEQLLLYESVVETILAQESLGINAFARRALFLRAILYLKQICIHPDLFYGNQDETEVVASIDEGMAASTTKLKKSIKDRVRHSFRQRSSQESDLVSWLGRSGKLTLLQELLQEWRLQSRGILLFTQYLGAAHMLGRLLQAGNDSATPAFHFLHGGLTAEQRTDMVEEFNDLCLARHHNDQCPVMILSLKAGGTGLNLTGADRVIHLDRWWNPAVEDQATDRAHRIGQRRTVFVHTLTSDATLEKSIGQIFVEKRQLAADLLGAASGDDVGEMLKDRGGFLSLVDPDQLFCKRLAPDQAGQGAGHD